jgi:hypothetical protein
VETVKLANTHRLGVFSELFAGAGENLIVFRDFQLLKNKERGIQNRPLLLGFLRHARRPRRHLHVGLPADPRPPHPKVATGELHHRHEPRPGLPPHAQEQRREHADLVGRHQQSQLSELVRQHNGISGQ